MEVIMKLKIFLYQATSLGDNGVIFKKNIGIHTGNPSATLHIQGSKNYGGDATSHLNISDNTHNTTTQSGINLSLLINPGSNNGNIGLNGSIYYYSDERIKTEIEEVPDSLALSQINNIEPKYYHYRDPLKRRDVKTVGFIAQNVNEQLPNAIFKQTDFIPNALHKVADSEWKEENGTYSLTFENLALDISIFDKKS